MVWLTEDSGIYSYPPSPSQCPLCTWVSQAKDTAAVTSIDKHLMRSHQLDKPRRMWRCRVCNTTADGIKMRTHICNMQGTPSPTPTQPNTPTPTNGDTDGSPAQCSQPTEGVEEFITPTTSEAHTITGRLSRQRQRTLCERSRIRSPPRTLSFHDAEEGDDHPTAEQRTPPTTPPITKQHHQMDTDQPRTEPTPAFIGGPQRNLGTSQQPDQITELNHLVTQLMPPTSPRPPARQSSPPPPTTIECINNTCTNVTNVLTNNDKPRLSAEESLPEPTSGSVRQQGWRLDQDRLAEDDMEGVEAFLEAFTSAAVESQGQNATSAPQNGP